MTLDVRRLIEGQVGKDYDDPWPQEPAEEVDIRKLRNRCLYSHHSTRPSLSTVVHIYHSITGRVQSYRLRLKYSSGRLFSRKYRFLIESLFPCLIASSSPVSMLAVSTVLPE